MQIQLTQAAQAACVFFFPGPKAQTSLSMSWFSMRTFTENIMSKKISAVSAIVVVLCLVQAAMSQQKSFILTANSITAKYTSTYLGNGNVGVASSRLGTSPTHSYMAWIYEHHPGDVARIASLPAWDAVNFFDGHVWLNDVQPTKTAIADYRQVLDMYNATLTTAYRWNDGKRAASISIVSFVSRNNPNLAATAFTLTTHYAGAAKISFPITQWKPPHRVALAEDSTIRIVMVNGLPNVWYPGHMAIKSRGASHGDNSGGYWATASPDGNPARVAIAARVTWSSRLEGESVSVDTASQGSAVTISFRAKTGKTYRFYRYVGIYSTHESNKPLKEARQTAQLAASQGYRTTLERHEAAWHRLWKTDITLTGNGSLQKVVHSSMYYILSSARAGSDFGIPPMGLSSDGYYGHIFWDSDTWMFPTLLLMHPQIAKSLVMFRYKALPAAEANARLNGYKGAMYPWESDENGNEACPKFAYQNALWENHVTGDVAFAQWQYYLATENKSWLEHYGYPVIKETADFWDSRCKYNPSNNTYNIDHVVSVDEGLIGVNNDAYTNLVARRNLEIATRAAKLLGKKPDPMWTRVAGHMYIPYDSTKHCYLTYQNAPPQSLGAVVPLLYYPLELKVPNDVKRNDLINALHFMKKNGTGVMMGITLYQIVAAEIQNRQLFEDFFHMSYKSYIRGSFNVFAETPENMSTNFLTGSGGFLQQVVFGYTGLRITNNGLTKEFKPMLPTGVTSMKITNLHFRGKTYNVEVKNGKTELVQK